MVASCGACPSIPRAWAPGPAASADRRDLEGEQPMEFLLRITVTWPPDGDEAEKQRRITAEGVRARELAAEGIIKRVWRIPGQWANYGLWEAPDATTIHNAVTSLP